MSAGRNVTGQSRSGEVSELAQIIADNLEKKRQQEELAAGGEQIAVAVSEEIDPVTGLFSFRQFRGAGERIIAMGCAESYTLISADLVNFSAFNEKYGYPAGDQLLKEFANYFYGGLQFEEATYFSRIGADHFVMLLPKERGVDENDCNLMNEKFLEKMKQKYPASDMRIRVGMTSMKSGCSMASAIAAADAARKQVNNDTGFSAKYIEMI